MSNWDKLVEKKIRDAMSEGEFDDLQGKGQPLNLDENPFEDPTMRTAHRLLRNNGFTLAWITERNEIETAIDEARASLARSWDSFQEAQKSRRVARQAEDDWRHFQNTFRRQVADINRRIAAYNLRAPSPTLHRMPLDAEREIVTIMHGK